MSSSTTTTCDGCGKKSIDGEPERITSFYEYGENCGHFCETCWKRGLAAMKHAPAPTPEQTAKAVAEAKAAFDARVEKLIATHAATTEKHNEERERWYREREDMEREHASHVANIQHATNHHVREAEDRAGNYVALAVELRGLVGKKKARKHAARLAEIDAILSTYLGG